ncbi:MAG TPA: 30S ribosomal protein S4 [Eubacteriales bacterium]|jgi:small subunit ribosomal protein S4|nr:30S ribosomal protein S4 [Clostridia bacterium]HRR89750.1 30S ribosomal protein S4 [Eubacteriales bacterium]HRU83838.1 30S ribosomal protein S4 [Eubacteriales bacterium]
MARYVDADCRLCRREGCQLYLKGDKCYSPKCTIKKRPIVPGQHGAGRKKQSGYSIQLREKQKTKRAYGLLERQFRMYYEKAAKMRGVTGENMLVLIERRLDNVAYRLGLGASRDMARQIVTHGHLTVNGKNVNIPSYLVKAGDVIAVKQNKKELPMWKELKGAKISTPKWLTFDGENLVGTVTALPERSDITDIDIKEHLIVELYSR